MLNEHETRDREHIAVLEMLQISVKLTEAHSKLLMRRFSEARELLFDVRARVSSLLDLIPKEKGD